MDDEIEAISISCNPEKSPAHEIVEQALFPPNARATSELAIAKESESSGSERKRRRSARLDVEVARDTREPRGYRSNPSARPPGMPKKASPALSNAELTLSTGSERRRSSRRRDLA